MEREIWWCSIGINVGHEVDGKGKNFNRPLLIVRKFNNRLFWGIPLTTQIKQNPFYLQIRFQEQQQCVLLTHLHLWEGKRLTHKMGKLPNSYFQEIKQDLSHLLLL